MRLHNASAQWVSPLSLTHPDPGALSVHGGGAVALASAQECQIAVAARPLRAGLVATQTAHALMAT